MSAVEAPVYEKSCNTGNAPDLQPPGLLGQFCHRDGGDFTLHFTLHARLVLMGSMLQGKADYRDTCRGVSKFGDFRHLTSQHQPVVIHLGCGSFRNRCVFLVQDRLGLLFLHHGGRRGNGFLHGDSQMTQHGIVELERILEFG